jgi:hypothetical protein
MVVVAKINGEDVLIDGTVGQFIRPDRRIAGTKWGVKKNVDDNPTTSDLAKQGYAVLKPGDLDRYKHFMDPKTDLVIEGTSEQKRNPVERRWESKTSSSSPSSTSTSSSKEYDPKSETYMEQVARHKKEREESDKSWRESQQNAYLNACAMAELYGREPPKKEDYEL